MSNEEVYVDVESGMKPLFERAEKEGLWFYCHYQNLWFSPKELREQNSKGKFWWGAVNWTLRSPDEYMKILQSQVAAAQKELSDFEERMI